MSEGKGFEIKCLECSSTNCELDVEEQYEYGYDEELEYWGSEIRIKCNDCGQSE